MLLAQPVVPVSLWTFPIASWPTNPCTIKWVDCSLIVPSLLEGTGGNLTDLPSMLRCGQLDVPMDYTKPISAIDTITLGLAMYRPANPKGVIS